MVAKKLYLMNCYLAGLTITNSYYCMSRLFHFADYVYSKCLFDRACINTFECGQDRPVVKMVEGELFKENE